MDEATLRLTAMLLDEFERACRQEPAGRARYFVMGDEKLQARLIFATMAKVIAPIVGGVGELKVRLDRLENEDKP